ncbi:MAG TPA: hypothetical protein DG753_03940 [Clostridium sp.]|nr:hypothetical protein [Clostridium sp.]
MNEEEAVRVIKQIRNSSIGITVLYFMFSVILPIRSFEADMFIYEIIPIVVMLAIFNGLAFGVYRYRSRVCAIVLFIFSIFMLKELLAIDGKAPLLICAMLWYIYYKGIKATFYFHNNRLADY